MAAGPLILVSGPSGSGKSTLIRRVLDDPPFPLRLAVSATTRPPRAGEIDGVHYYFWTPERFEAELAAGAFLEHAVVHRQHHYGTPRSEVDGYRERGIGVILDIDVQGADQVRPVYPEHLSIFVDLSRFEMYEERLRQRGTETPESIDRRLDSARRELARRGDYQHVVHNDDLNEAVARFREILTEYQRRLTCTTI
jgi:guanylate kinase